MWFFGTVLRNAGEHLHVVALCKRSGKTVVVVTHNGALAPSADILIRMKSGMIPYIRRRA